MTAIAMRRAALFVLLFIPALPAQAQFFQESAAFRFNSNAFWLNLHNFLYVLGRAHSNAADAGKGSIAIALADEERGLATMKPEDVAVWRRSVDLYASGLSSLDAAFDDSMISATVDLATSGDAPNLGPTTRIDGATRNALEGAAAIYRRAFWPTHTAANRRFEGGMLALIAKYQRPIVSQITRRYGVSWPGTGYLIYLSPYTGGMGAYTVPGPMTLMSSATQEMTGSVALEAVFAEAMHQWDQSMTRRLTTAAAAKNTPVDEWLVQGLIYYTAGDAVRRAVPAHVPNATKFNYWQGHERIRQALDAAWLPWLNGTGYSDDAIALLVARASTASAPAPRSTPRRRR